MDGFSDRGSIPLISILDFHGMAIVARRRETQHISGLGMCFFIFSINCTRENMQIAISHRIVFII